MATMMPASALREEHQKVRALIKHESRRIADAEDLLRPFEDEKMAIYQQQLGDMSYAFTKSREVRSFFAEEYDSRNKQVMDKLALMRARTDKEGRRHLDRLKAFSNEFDEAATAAKKNWRLQFASDEAALSGRCTASGEEITSLDAEIKQEHEDCIAHASAETGPILEALARHGGYLTQQVAERDAQNEQFEATLREQFGRLRRRRAEESLARRAQYEAGCEEAAMRYRKLDEQLQSQDLVSRRQLEQLQAQLAGEQHERTSSEELVVSNMMRFMSEFERNNAENNARQETTKAHLLGMKATLRKDAAAAGR